MPTARLVVSDGRQPRHCPTAARPSAPTRTNAVKYGWSIAKQGSHTPTTPPPTALGLTANSQVRLTIAARGGTRGLCGRHLPGRVVPPHRPHAPATAPAARPARDLSPPTARPRPRPLTRPVPAAEADASRVHTTAFGCQGDHRPKTRDAEIVTRLRAAGAIIVGRTHTSEFGQWPTGETCLGTVRNPWNRDHTPGGSSAGSAAAVAAGMVAAAGFHERSDTPRRTGPPQGPYPAIPRMSAHVTEAPGEGRDPDRRGD